MELLNGFYEILNLDKPEQDKLVALVKIDKHHPIFKGHFPNHPVTPGVCTMQIIKELSENWANTNLMLKTARNVKFMAIINPELNDLVQFELQFENTNEDEISVKTTVLIEENPALKFSGLFQKI
jgi:3-hydroxyacyl-[acyl-carrier-protein] dehydratase